AQLIDRIPGALVRLHRGELELLEQMTGILLGQGDEITPGSALRNQDPAIWKGLFDQLAIREIEREQELSRFLLHAHVATGKKYRNDVGVVFAVDIRQESLLPGEQFT